MLAFVATELVVKPIVARARPFQTSVPTRVIDRRPLTFSFLGGAVLGLACVWVARRILTGPQTVP